ncbi:unnamed protein product, partial [Ixodes hexagonus]
VFPLTETWHVLYRNFEEDPAFGTSKCLRFSQVSPEKDGGYPVVAQYGQENQSTGGQREGLRRGGRWGGVSKGLITLQSSEGYTAKNEILFHPEGQNQVVTFVVSYLNPNKCGVNRDPYVNDGACCVLVPESQLGKDTTCCDFIYSLLCGTSKYQIYDDSCRAQN